MVSYLALVDSFAHCEGRAVIFVRIVTSKQGEVDSSRHCGQRGGGVYVVFEVCLKTTLCALRAWAQSSNIGEWIEWR